MRFTNPLQTHTHNQRGFTIVELLIVIVVIGILAAITIVAYNGVQQKARDAQRKSDLSTIAKAIQARAVNTDLALNYSSSCASTSATVGFLAQKGMAKTGADYGTKSAMDCLVEQSPLSKGLLDPSKETSCVSGEAYAASCFVYMFATCDSVTYIFAHLESIPVSSSATNDTCGNTQAWDSNFGMNYYIKI